MVQSVQRHYAEILCLEEETQPTYGLPGNRQTERWAEHTGLWSQRTALQQITRDYIEPPATTPSVRIRIAEISSLLDASDPADSQGVPNREYAKLWEERASLLATLARTSARPERQ